MNKSIERENVFILLTYVSFDACLSHCCFFYSPTHSHISSRETLPWMMSYWRSPLYLISCLSRCRNEQYQPTLPVMRSALDWPPVPWTTSEAFSSCLPLQRIDSGWQEGWRNWLGIKWREVKCACVEKCNEMVGLTRSWWVWCNGHQSFIST